MENRVINGIHRENFGFSWNWEDALKITDPLGGETILDAMLIDRENDYHYPQVRRLMGPKFLIHIRMYPETGWPDPSFGRHWCDLDPKQWAAECVRRLTDERLRYNGILPIEDPYVVITPANEQDLQVEGFSEAATLERPTMDKGAYDFIWNWNYEWAVEFKRLAPHHKCKLGSAPLAGGHDVNGYPPDYEYQLPSFRRYLTTVDIICLHAYFHPDGSCTRPDNGGYWDAGVRCLRPKGYREWGQGYPPINGIPDPGGVVIQYPDYPFMVTEFGNFRHHDSSPEGVNITIQGYKECYKAYSDTGRCLLVTPFLWNSGDEHRENRIRGNAPLTVALQNLERFSALTNNNSGDYSTGGNMPEYTYDWGFKELYRQFPQEIGKPVSELEALNPSGDCIQATEFGLLYWNKQANKNYFFRAVRTL